MSILFLFSGQIIGLFDEINKGSLVVVMGPQNADLQFERKKESFPRKLHGSGGGGRG